MEHIGIISNDPHLKAEIKAWLKDLPGDFEIIELGPPATGDPPKDTSLENVPESSTENAPDPKSLKLVIFDSNSQSSLKKWRQDFSLSGVPWLAIGREEHAKNPHDESIDGCEDLILLPMDRLVLLQKVELLLAGSNSITPSFLFLSKSELPIELAKAVHITHLSETGCTISAVKPVAQGVQGSLISRIFNAEENVAESVEVRVVSSNPYFESAIATNGTGDMVPKFEVKLRFFGLKQKQLLSIRKFLLRSYPQGFPEIHRSSEKPSQVFRVAMISPDTSQSSRLQSSLEDLTIVEPTNFGGLSSFRSYFLKRDAKTHGKNSAKSAPNSALVWSEAFIGPHVESFRPLMPSESVTLHLRLTDGVEPNKVERLSPSLKASDRLLDASIDMWLKDASILLKGLSEVDRETVLEGIDWVSNQAPSKKDTRFELDFNIDEFFSIKLSFKIHLIEVKTPSKPPLLSISIGNITEDETEEKTQIADTPFDAIMVDASLLQLDIKAKMAFLKDALETHKVENSFGHTSPIIVFNASEASFQAQDLRGTAARQLLYDINDRRYQAEMFISMSRPELWTTPVHEVSGLKTELRAYLSRPARATSVSEVSLTIVGRSAMKVGTELLVISPVWSQAPEGLWARLRSVTPEDGSHSHEFIFFGASDLVQKEIRKFTRAEYVRKKAQGQS